MFLGGGIYSVNEDHSETCESYVQNGHVESNDAFSAKTEKHVHFAVCFLYSILVVQQCFNVGKNSYVYDAQFRDRTHEKSA